LEVRLEQQTVALLVQVVQAEEQEDMVLKAETPPQQD
jgi:hypothetical protein